MPTGPRPLSAEAMMMFGLVLMSWSIFCCSLERLERMWDFVNLFLMSVQKRSMRVSMSSGGRGARQMDFTRNLYSGVVVSLKLS